MYIPTVKFPSGTDDSTKTFLISRNDLKIYGGFAGTETLLSDRDPALNITILSGEINTEALTDNCYHVVRFDPGPSFCDQSQPPCSGHCACQGGCTVYPSEITDSVQLDGFTVTKGYADGVTLFDQNRGGGMYLLFASPAIQNCTIVANFASERGGGVHALWPASFDQCAPSYPVPTPHFVSTSFLGNICEQDGGGSTITTLNRSLSTALSAATTPLATAEASTAPRVNSWFRAAPSASTRPTSQAAPSIMDIMRSREGTWRW